jgi:hypothetical protein
MRGGARENTRGLGTVVEGEKKRKKWAKTVVKINEQSVKINEESVKINE